MSLVPFRSRSILGRPLLHWYRGEPNFGDALAPALVEFLLGRPVRHASGPVNGKLLTIGSILGRAQPNDVVWGSGHMVDVRRKLPAATRVLAVRGPLTADRFGLSDEIPFGDPALLVPQWSPRVVPSEGRTIVITHHFEVAEHRQLVAAGYDVISAAAPRDEVLDRIQRASVVCSSALHGLVVAEAYGIPAVHVTLSDRVIGGTFKFRDYYEGTGRNYPGAHSLDEALEIAKSPPAVPDLSATVERLQATAAELVSLVASHR